MATRGKEKAILAYGESTAEHELWGTSDGVVWSTVTGVRHLVSLDSEDSDKVSFRSLAHSAFSF